MPVDMTEYERIVDRSEGIRRQYDALDRENAALEQELKDFLARLMVGNPEERAQGQQLLEALRAQNASEVAELQQQGDELTNWLVGG